MCRIFKIFLTQFSFFHVDKMDLLSKNQGMSFESLDGTVSANAIVEISSLESDKSFLGHELSFTNDSTKFDPGFLDTRCDFAELLITIDEKPVKIWQCKICK